MMNLITNEMKQRNETGNNSQQSGNTSNINSFELGRDLQEQYVEYLLRIPPDWEEARIHGQYSLLGKDVTQDLQAPQSPRNFFEVMNPNRKKKNYPICVNLSSIKSIGSGVAMLFQLKKWIILFELIILIPAIFSMIVNGTRGHAQDYQDSHYFVISLSLGNFGKPETISAADQGLMYACSYIHSAALVCILLLSYCFSRSQKQLELDVDDNWNTPSDYALFVRGIPVDVSQEEIIHSFEEKWKNQKVDVIRVNRIYDCGELISKQRKLLELQTKDSVVKLTKENKLDDLKEKNPQYEKNEKDLVVYDRVCLCCKRAVNEHKLEAEIEETRREIKNCYDHLALTEKCVIVFNNQRDVRMLDDKFDFNIFCKLWYWCQAKRCKKITKGYPVYDFKSPKANFKNKHIAIKRAPQPTDLYWQNLGVPFKLRLKNMLWTFVVTVVIISIAFTISFFLKKYQTDLEHDYIAKLRRGQTDLTADYIKVRGLSFFTSLVVVFFNRFLLIIIRILTAQEKHQTQTKNNVSIGVKITLATFVNSAIVPYIVNLDMNKHWFCNTGLVVDSIYNVISISFVTPFLYIFDIFFIIRRMKMCIEKRKKESTLTQKQANQLNEGPVIDMARLHSNTFLLFLMVIFYAPLSPFIAPIAMVGSIFAYWVQKTILLRRLKEPRAIGAELAYFYGNLIVWSLALYAFTNWFWFSKVSRYRHNTYAAVMCVVFLIYMFIPVRGFIKGYCQKKNCDPDERTYEQALPQFTTEYEYENPATRAMAVEMQVLELSCITIISEDEMQRARNGTIVDRDEMLNQKVKTKAITSMMSYAKKHKGVISQYNPLVQMRGFQSSKFLGQLAKQRNRKTFVRTQSPVCLMDQEIIMPQVTGLKYARKFLQNLLVSPKCQENKPKFMSPRPMEPRKQRKSIYLLPPPSFVPQVNNLANEPLQEIRFHIPLPTCSIHLDNQNKESSGNLDSTLFRNNSPNQLERKIQNLQNRRKHSLKEIEESTQMDQARTHQPMHSSRKLRPSRQQHSHFISRSRIDQQEDKSKAINNSRPYIPGRNNWNGKKQTESRMDSYKKSFTKSPIDSEKND